MTQLVWLRNDLRLQDNPALYQACAIGQPVRVIFCATAQQWQLHNESPRQLKLRESILVNLTSELAAMGICLDVIEVPAFIDLPNRLHSYCLEHRINALWINDQSWLNEQIRDKDVTAVLTRINIKVNCLADELLVNQPILTKEKTAYRVFTPWYKQWLLKLQSTNIQLLPAPYFGNFPPLKQWCKPVLALASDFREDIFPPSEQDALSRLINFTQQGALDYAYYRDFPGINGTSLLSPYLAVGAISIRQCYVYLQQACLEQQAPIFENVWLKELAWREFYRYLMIHNTAIAKGEAYNSHKEPNWLDAPEHFKAWQQGATGFPIIDAAMIQLKRTGWMHNRLRMLTASFLCKLLMIDWRLGEAHFMEFLLDGDFSSNNGGWQWSASVGCDASPWFRIFNPTTQSKKFDSKGDFIRKMLPQLSKLSDKDIHWPSNKQRDKFNYSLPIIDYTSCRKRALNWKK